MKHYQFRVWDYDVWGNNQDGFQVNDRYEICDDLIIAESIIMDDKKLIQAIRPYIGLKKHLRYSNFTIDGEPDYSMYVDYSGFPVCELECIKVFQ